MDGYQQSHRYMRPPPPAGDQYHHHNPYLQQQQQPLPQQQRPPQVHQWYPNQFQYQSPVSHSPSPPPPPPPPPLPSQWVPAPASSAYPPPPHPYPAHHHNNPYALPPRPHVPPPPPPPPQVAPSYSQGNQDWGNPNWVHHQQSWDYSAHNNVQDWAARAKEWANSRSAMENQHMLSQFTSAGRPEEQTRYNDQHQQSADFRYADTQQQPIPASSYQQFPVPAAPTHQPPVAYQQENASISSELSSYGPDVHLPYSSRDGVTSGEANVGFPHQESSHSIPSVHQQEVPSSYSSVTGKQETADQKELMYRSLPVPISSAQEGQLLAYGNQAANPSTDLSDQPLDFAPRFNNEHDPHMQSSYAAHHESAGAVRGVDPAVVLPSVNNWTPPVTPGVVYPPIPPVIPAGAQHDPSIAMASVSGPSAPQFGRFTGQSFQPIPSANAFGISAGSTLHPTTAFASDAYGISGVSERPRKAPVPNWLKEEIIKNKATITKSSLENPNEKTESIEEGVHKLSGKSDLTDSKSIDSSRSTEEEDEDEDYVEATRTAAINQEIKRILTEVLLKVTDELFDEIATKVLSEDDLSIEDNDNTVSSIRKLSLPPPAIPTPKASAKVLVPVKAKESGIEGGSEKTSSSAPGDILGLANYASDDDDGDDEIQSSSVPNSINNVVQQPTMNKLSEYIHDAAENGSHVKPEEQNGTQTNSRRDLNKASTSVSKNNSGGAVSKLSENIVDKNEYSSNAISVEGGDNESNVDGGKLLDSNNGSKSNETLRGKAEMKISANDSSQSSEARMKPVKNDQHESKSSFGKDSVKEVGTGSVADDKGDRNHRRHDERHSRKEKTDDLNGSRDRMRDEDAKPEEKAKESKSKKRSTDGVKEDGRDAERYQTASTKVDFDKKTSRSKEEDALIRNVTNDSGRHKRRHSSSTSSRVRNSKDGSASHANDSDDSSEDSKRKQHSRKRHSSPSPVRSKTRQVTRSPHSKHSQRRHSPYSSLEIARRRRSRSRSPGRRQR